MKRRSILAAIGTVAVAGCLSDGSPGDSNDTDEPEVRDPEAEAESEIEQRLAFGEWSEFDKFGVTVDGVELVDSVTLAAYGDEVVHDFGPDRLAVVDYQLKAIASEPPEYLARSIDLELVVDGDRRDAEIGDVFDEYNMTVSDVTMRESRKYGHYARTFEPGGVGEHWTGAIVSSGISADDVAIAVDGIAWGSER